MALLISNAILHVLGASGRDALFSNQELDIDSETCYDFISKHVRRLMNNPAAKEAVFSAESKVYGLVKSYQKGEMRFRDLSVALCGLLREIMAKGEEIPAADILVTAFDNGDKRYLAILKLNYGECFTHKLVESADGAENHIIKNTAVLPMGSKVEEACLIPWDPMVLRILEKPYAVGGEEVNYFSQLFLQCETEISKKEAAEIIQDIADEINAKYFDDNVETAARLKCAIMDEAAEAPEDEGFILENVVNRAFRDHEEVKEDIKTEFVAMAKEYGLPHEVKLDKPFAQRQFKTQRFRADNGIEVKCPSELFYDPETVEWVNNADGTVSITLKNLRRHSSE